jgi:hypothetical protein
VLGAAEQQRRSQNQTTAFSKSAVTMPMCMTLNHDSKSKMNRSTNEPSQDRKRRSMSPDRAQKIEKIIRETIRKEMQNQATKERETKEREERI